MVVFNFIFFTTFAKKINMITPNELRIGNYIIDFHSEAKITAIGLDYISTDRGVTKIQKIKN